MKHSFYSETSNQLLFTIFDDAKPQKTNMYRIHRHAELELGFIVSGEGDYHLEDERYTARAGDLFLIRTNEQHCIPTIITPELVSFNVYITSYFLWNVCSEFIDSLYLKLLVDTERPICHRFSGCGELVARMRPLLAEPELNRFAIRRAMLGLLEMVTDELALSEPSGTGLLPSHLDDVQTAIRYINEHLIEPMTLDDIAAAVNMSRSNFSRYFRLVTGITPYEYLLIQRVERASSLLRETDKTVLHVAFDCGFASLASFNRTFKRVTGITPRDYRLNR